MVYLWFKADVSAWDRKRSHTLLTKELVPAPIIDRSHVARVLLEISPDKRPLSKFQAIILGAMFKATGLGREPFVIRRLTNGVGRAFCW